MKFNVREKREWDVCYMTASPITAVGKLSCVYDTSREIVAQLSSGSVTNAKGLLYKFCLGFKETK